MELDGFGQADALIKHWLNETPADDEETFVNQIKQASWLEDRHYHSLARLLGVLKK